MIINVFLVKEIVERFHSKEAADAAEQEFINRFKKGAAPADMPEVTVTTDADETSLAKVLKEAGLVPTSSEGYRNIEQGGVHINGEKIADKTYKLKPGQYTVQVGKRKWAKITLTKA